MVRRRMRRRYAELFWNYLRDSVRESDKEETMEDEKMETKSRYEVISELEAKKRELIFERESLPDKVKSRETRIKLLKRDLEDAEDDLKDFKTSLAEKKAMINEMIKSVDDSLKRFEKFNTSKSQKK